MRCSGPGFNLGGPGHRSPVAGRMRARCEAGRRAPAGQGPRFPQPGGRRRAQARPRDALLASFRKGGSQAAEIPALQAPQSGDAAGLRVRGLSWEPGAAARGLGRRDPRPASRSVQEVRRLPAELGLLLLPGGAAELCARAARRLCAPSPGPQRGFPCSGGGWFLAADGEPELRRAPGGCGCGAGLPSTGARRC